MKALIIIDVQNDFLPNGALGVPDGDEIIPVINKLQKKFDLTVATQDWHPKDHGSFASNHEGKDPFDKTELGGLEQILWPDHCVQGTKGAEFAKELSMESAEAIFRKGMEKDIDTYSGFYDNGHKKTTGLSEYLKGRAVKEVYVAGLAGDVCVNFTMLDALYLGFEAHLVKDATRAIDDEKFEEALKVIAEKGGKIVISSDIE